MAEDLAKLHNRLDSLEERLDALESDASPAVSRRSVLGGVAGLAGLGALTGSASGQTVDPAGSNTFNDVTVTNLFTITDTTLYIQSSTPSSPSTGDVWIDTS